MARKNKGVLGIRLLMSIGVLCLPNLQANGKGDADARVELECRILHGAAPSAGARPLDRYLVEIQTPTGRVITQATTQGGGRLNFNRLFPGIFVVCVIASDGGRRCQSVDVTAAPDQKLAKFRVELQTPSPSWSPAQSLFVVPKEALRIPKKARREFDRARKAQAQCDTAEATRRLETALEIWPDYRRPSSIWEHCVILRETTTTHSIVSGVPSPSPQHCSRGG